MLLLSGMRHERRITQTSEGTLIDELRALREAVGVEGDAIYERWRPRLGRLSFLPSAHNLAAYLAFRKHDVRALQDELASWGLSSLGRSEARILASLDAVGAVLAKLLDQPAHTPSARRAAADFRLGERLLARNTRRLLGELAPERSTHIMVTLPERAETDAAFVEELVARGMTSARINCAHGSHDQWRAMARHVRAAEARLGRTCRVVMDLSGPRARTLAVRSKEERKVVAGDRVLLRATPPAPDGDELPFQAQCAPPEILDALGVGAKLSIDEARVEARVEAKVAGGVVAQILRTAPGGVRLKPEKALNFPGTALGIPALTEKDHVDLDVIVENADIIGYSFVQDVGDVEALWREIERRRERARRWPPGLILKIETERAVRHLPDLIVAAGGHLPVGVMIARGDLAVEVGFERLAELQEEILWLAEAAHTPVVWATQVLDRLVRKGTPSRAEISDVVLAQRAECVMLNKGEFVLEALSIVDEVCRRMGGHQHKKTARLRALQAWSQVAPETSKGDRASHAET
jgi:pyruvate kinase